MEQAEENLMFEHLDPNSRPEFISSILFYVGGFIVSKLERKLMCEASIKSLVCEITPSKVSDHNYCGSSVYSEVCSASAFTLFVNNGELRIPSKQCCSSGAALAGEAPLLQALGGGLSPHLL